MLITLALVRHLDQVLALVRMAEPATPGEFDPETLRAFLEERVFRETPVALILESPSSAPSVVAPPEIADAIDTADLDAIEWTTLDLPQTPPHMS